MAAIASKKVGEYFAKKAEALRRDPMVMHILYGMPGHRRLAEQFSEQFKLPEEKKAAPKDRKPKHACPKCGR